MRRFSASAQWAMILVLAAATAGCSGGGGRGGVSRLAPRPAPFLEGVPVPKGFDMVNRMTEDYESGGQRTARHMYRGFADPAEVRDFYREQMPLTGWSRVSDQNVKGRRTLRFERRNEACTVEIEGNWMNHTTIQVILNPFSRNPSEPPRRPVP